ncbi:unnamed protein product, partial [Owenia fusiformis]
KETYFGIGDHRVKQGLYCDSWKQGSLTVLLRQLLSDDGPRVSDELFAKLVSLQQQAARVSDLATPFIAKNEPEYYAKIGVILDQGFWEMDYTSRDLDENLVLPRLVAGEVMRENDSDNCLAELFATGGMSDIPCQISERCWLLMTAPGYNQYSLSHQVFYLQIGKQFGCAKEMHHMRKINRQHSLDNLVQGFCANMLKEANQIAGSNYPPTWRDLFMEQAGLCGMMGYRQFVNLDWLSNILTWQYPNGCFGQILPEELDFERTHAPHRSKREEKVLEGGCLSHRTAVAVCAMPQYIRYILEFMDTKSEVIEEIDTINVLSPKSLDQF